MKRFILKLTAILMILITGITGCNKPENCNYIDGKGCDKVEISKKEFLTMCIVPYEVTANSSNKLIICNHTKKDICHEYSSMDYFNGNNWEPIEFGYFGYQDVAHYLPAGKESEFETSLYSLVEKYNNSKKGKYRSRKKICGPYYLVAEFEVK